MTQTSELLKSMFTEPTAHHLCDSGGIYGRAYRQNATRDFAAEPQAKITIGKWGLEVSVNTFQHLEACLELDDLCEEFNALSCDAWDSEKADGISEDQERWLTHRGFTFDGDTWNSYNWDNMFDQTLQGTKLLNAEDEEYVLLQIHGGCDVRSGYTDAKLFKIQDWMSDYFLDDTVSFDLERATAEAAGYESPEPVYATTDWISFDVRGWSGAVEVYDHQSSDNEEIPLDFWDNLPKLKIEGVQRAIEH